VGFPRFRDYDKFFFDYVDMAQRENKYGCALKCRNTGYSYKGASMLCRNFFLIPNSKNFAVASKKDFLLRDGILNKTWSIMEFLNTETAWRKSIMKGYDNKIHKKFGIRRKDEYGKWIEEGFLSEVMGIVIGDDPEKMRGIRATLIVIDEAGSCKHLKEIWAIADSSVRQGDNLFGWMFAMGTGAHDNEDVEGVRDIFLNPTAFNVLGIPNIWDEDAYDT